jgi:hypothetical protein
MVADAVNACCCRSHGCRRRAPSLLAEPVVKELAEKCGGGGGGMDSGRAAFVLDAACGLRRLDILCWMLLAG